MSSNTNKQLVTSFIANIWNGNHLEQLNDWLTSDYYDHSYSPRNREGLERTLVMMRAAFPDHETTIEEIVGEDDIVAVCMTLRGTHLGPFRGVPATGNRFEVGGYRFYTLRDGKISVHRALLDLPALLQQIGVSL